MRVGIHTGPVVVAREHGGVDIFGKTPNVAARVQALAAPDTVLITAATQHLVAGLFVVEEGGTQSLKGVREPVAIYRVITASGVCGRIAAAARTTGPTGLTSFVGRESERRTLRERWESAREGEGQVVVLVGEPGIAKSRLARQFREDIGATPHTWLESGGTPYFADTPFYVVTELLGAALHVADGGGGDRSGGCPGARARVGRRHRPGWSQPAPPHRATGLPHAGVVDTVWPIRQTIEIGSKGVLDGSRAVTAAVEVLTLRRRALSVAETWTDGDDGTCRAREPTKPSTQAGLLERDVVVVARVV